MIPTLLLLVGTALAGCAAPTADFTKMKRPARAPELDAFNVFVGTWNWEAEAANADAAHKKWTGTAKWNWTLDQRCLHGEMSAKSADTEFQTAGVWSWHPVSKKYVWWMFNNWGFPQSGTARYDAAKKHWKMTYTSVGLDGTTSHGMYEMTAVDNDNLKWSMTEWADMMHSIKKIEMCGTYKRTK
jgi:hypothetical protein